MPVLLLARIGKPSHNSKVAIQLLPVKLGCTQSLTWRLILDIAEPPMCIILQRWKTNLNDLAVLESVSEQGINI